MLDTFRISKIHLSSLNFNSVCIYQPKYNYVYMFVLRVQVSPIFYSWRVHAQYFKLATTFWEQWFCSRQGQDLFLSSEASRPALGPSLHPILLRHRALSPVSRMAGCEVNHLPLSTADNKNKWRCKSARHIPSWYA